MFTIKVEQHFNKKSIEVLRKSIGKNRFRFILNYVHVTLDFQPENNFTFCPNRGVNLAKIVSSNSLGSTISNVSIPPFFYPFNNFDKYIQVSENTEEKIDWENVNTISVSGILLKIEIYNFKEEIVSYDVHSLEGHKLENQAINPPASFDCLKTIFDYFVYLVFHFDNDKLLIIERPESSDIVNFHYKNSEELFKHIKEYRDEDSGKLQYYLANEIS